jgi:hypothetical protein
VGGGAAKVPVVDLEGSGQAEQRLDGQECDLPSGRNRASPHEFPELQPRLTDREVQVVGTISHMARLLFACSAKEIFALLTTTELVAVG